MSADQGQFELITQSRFILTAECDHHMTPRDLGEGKLQMSPMFLFTWKPSACRAITEIKCLCLATVARRGMDFSDEAAEHRGVITRMQLFMRLVSLVDEPPGLDTF